MIDDTFFDDCSEPVSLDKTGPYFRDDIDRMRDRHAYPCVYIDVPYIRVDYRALNRCQLEYYLYWRDRFWEGEMLRTCEGYLWLLANEIGVSDRDPVSTFSLLMRLWKERRFDLFDPTLFIEFLRDYAIENNLPQPAEDVFGCDNNEVLVNTIACCPEWNLDVGIISELSGGSGMIKGESDTVCRIVDISLRRLNLMLENNGSSLFDKYSSSNLENVYDLYRNYRLLRDNRVAVDSPGLFHNNDFRTLVKNMTRYAASLVRGMRGSDRPGELSDIVREIMDGCYDDLEDDGPEYRPQKAVTKAVPVPRSYIARGLHSSIKEDIHQHGDNRVNVMIERNRKVLPLSASKSVHNWKNDSDEPAIYVQSGFINPSYDTFNSRQMDYYMYWRTQIRNGKFLETDDGYIRFFIAEIISCSEDPFEAVRIMRSLSEVYNEPNLARFITTAILEYSLVFGIPVDDVRGASESILNGVAYLCMIRAPMGDMPAEVLASLSGLDRRVIDDLGEEGLKAINESLRKIEKERLALGIPTTLELFNVQRGPQSAFYTIKRDFPVSLYNSSYQALSLKKGAPLRTYISNTIRLVETFVRKINGKKVTVKMPKYHGKRTLRIIESCVLSAFGIETEKRIRLDPEAVKNAQGDLEAVTDLMITEGTEDEETVEEEVQTTGWEALASMLDENQKEYLSKALDSGRGCAEIARKSNMTVSKMEDSINTLSMDAVGDTIVENQTVVEDYFEEVRSIVISQ